MIQNANPRQPGQPVHWVYLIIYALFMAVFYTPPTVESMVQIQTAAPAQALFTMAYHFIHLAPAGYLLIRAFACLTDHSVAGKCLKALRGGILLITALLFPLFLMSENLSGPATGVMLTQYFCALSLAAGLPRPAGQNHWARGAITLIFPIIASGWSLSSQTLAALPL